MAKDVPVITMEDLQMMAVYRVAHVSINEEVMVILGIAPEHREEVQAQIIGMLEAFADLSTPVILDQVNEILRKRYQEET